MNPISLDVRRQPFMISGAVLDWAADRFSLVFGLFIVCVPFFRVRENIVRLEGAYTV